MIHSAIDPQSVIPPRSSEAGACRFCGSVNTYAHRLSNSSQVHIVCNSCQAIGPAGHSLDDAISQWNGDRLKVGTPRLTAVPAGTPVGQGVAADVLREDSEKVMAGQFGPVDGYALVLLANLQGKSRTHVRLHGMSKSVFEAFCRKVSDQSLAGKPGCVIEGGSR